MSQVIRGTIFRIAQPFYVLAGWLVPEPFAAEADRLVASVVRQRQDAGGELKASRLLRSAHGRELARTLLDSLLELGCRPVFSLYEKRWMVAAKLMELFCDPRTNRRARNIAHADALSRERLAEQIYQLPVEALEAVWAAARRNPSILSIQPPPRRLLGLLRLLPDPLLNLLFEGAFENLGQIMAGLVRQETDPYEKFLDAPCAPALSAVLSNVNLVVADDSGSTVHVIHDESATFGPTLTETFELLSVGPEVRIEVNNGNYFRFVMERFVGFELRGS